MRKWIVASVLMLAAPVFAAEVHVMISAGFFGVYSELGLGFEKAGRA